MAKDGLRQILWGLFKKIVIADTCAEYANAAFNNPVDHTGSTYLAGIIFFAFQIYCDFSGYSDIALGSARLFGIELLRNFAFPYFSRDIAEFWRRWHISLSRWFRDYLYFPLGGSKGGTWMKIRNTFIIFLVSGFWHGANWTFIVWGGLNAFYFLPLMILDKNRDNLDIVAIGRIFPTFKDFLNIAITFVLTLFAWKFCRANSIHHAFQYIGNLFSKSVFSLPEQLSTVRWEVLSCLIVFLLTVEWLGRENRYGIEKTFFNKPKVVRWGFYYLIITMMFIFSGKEQQFIYFQF
jgi:D-alanyl-lipoteichoic acid acyltransferase DltB (MBOAT superfamily)